MSNSTILARDNSAQVLGMDDGSSWRAETLQRGEIPQKAPWFATAQYPAAASPAATGLSAKTRELIDFFVAAAVRYDPSIAQYAAIDIRQAHEGLIGALAARIEALLHRPSDYRETILRSGPLELDLIERTARRGSRQLDLLPREFKLLEYLMRREGQLVTRAMLFEEVWNYRFVPDSNLVDVHLGRLRRKVDYCDEVPMIHSIRGAGFMLRLPPCRGTPAHHEPSAFGRQSRQPGSRRGKSVERG